MQRRLKQWLCASRHTARQVFDDLLTSVETDQAAPRQLSLAELEERIMLSASPAAVIAPESTIALDEHVVVVDVAQVTQPENPTADADADDANDVAGPSDDELAALWHESNQLSDVAAVEPKELIVIDTATPGYGQLVDDLMAQQDRPGNFEFVFLDRSRNGVAQITQALSEHRDLDAIHIVSHGNSDGFQLGRTWFDGETAAQYETVIAGWSHALSADADILIYGCELANSQDGRDLLTQLSQTTGADVAGSDDKTGHESLGGDWSFEYTVGQIESDVAFSESLQSTWYGTLATVTVDSTSDSVNGDTSSISALIATPGIDGAISLREAILATNATLGADTIEVNPGTISLTNFSFTDDTNATIGDWDIFDDVTIVGDGIGSTIFSSNIGNRLFEVHNGATVTIENATLQNGQQQSGAAVRVLSGGNLTLDQVLVTGNNSASNDGGAIHNAGVVTIVDSTLSGNTSGFFGGAIFNDSTGILSITGSLFDSNSDFDSGGAIRNLGTASLTNSTLSGNISAAGSGGVSSSGVLNLTNVTVANSVGYGLASNGLVNIQNTIITGSTVDDVAAAVTSGGGNLISDNSGLGWIGSDQVNTDPALSALADNGGRTHTMALQAGSAAIGAGVSAGAPADDQRGFTRDANVDVGAYEFAASVSVNTAPTFYGAADGIAEPDYGTGTDEVGDTIELASGQLLTVGQSNDQLRIARHNPDGTLDTSFNGTGYLVAAIGDSSYGYAVEEMADGRIIVAGTTETAGTNNFLVARFDADGSFDNTFSGDGIFTYDSASTIDRFNDIEVLVDGTVYAIGTGTEPGGSSNEEILVFKIDNNGTLDTGFGAGDGIVGHSPDAFSEGVSIAVQSDGKVVIGGSTHDGSDDWDFYLARLNSDGSLDGTERVAIGSGRVDNLYAIELTSAQDVIAVGRSLNGVDRQTALIKLDGTSFSLDNTFGTGGIVSDAILSFASDLAIDGSGNIFVGGTNNFFTASESAVVKFDSSGAVDTSFGTSGIREVTVSAGADFGRKLILTSDGNLLLTGDTSAATHLIQMDATGALDTTFGPESSLGGAVSYTEGASNAVALDVDVTVFDAELVSPVEDFGGAVLTFERVGGGNPDDNFNRVTTSNLTFTGSSFLLSGVTKGNYGSSNGTLTLTFAAGTTNADVNEVMQSVGYRNFTDDPPASVDIQWTFSDGNTGNQGTGGALTATGTTTVNITPVNDQATTDLDVADATASGQDSNVVFSGTPINIAMSDAIVIDPDSTSFVRMDVQITNLLDGTDEVLAVDVSGYSGFNASYNTTFGSLIITGTGTHTDYQDILRAITYDNTALTPDATTRIISVEITDGGGFGAMSFSNVIFDQPPTDLVVTEAAGSNSGFSLNEDGGNDAYLLADDDTVLNGHSGFTFEFQFSDLAVNGTMATLMSHQTASTNSYISVHADGTLDFAGFTTTAQYSQLIGNGDHAVTVSWNGGTGEIRYYVDGEFAESVAGPTGITVAGGGALAFGQDMDSIDGNYDATETFSGKFRDIRLFSSVRSDTEIQAGHDSALPPDEQNMIANWQFDSIQVNGGIVDHVSGNDLTVSHVGVGGGFANSDPELNLRVSEFAADGTVVGSVTGIDAERTALIQSLLTANPDLIFVPESNSFIAFNSTPVNWATAQSNAAAATLNGVSGYLATIQTASENAQVRAAAQSAGLTGIWLGASDANTEGEWQWYDGGVAGDQFADASGNSVNGYFTNFGALEPSGGATENYLEMDVVANQWNDLSGTSFRNYAVEYDADEVLDGIGSSGDQPLAYSILSQTEAGTFNIDADTGQITVADGSLLHYETNVSHLLKVRVADVSGNIYEEDVVIAVNNLDSPPTDLSSGIELNTDGGNDAFLESSNGGVIFGSREEVSVDVSFQIDPSAGIAPHLFSYATASEDEEFKVYLGSSDQLSVTIGGNTFVGNAHSELRDGGLHQVSVTWDSSSGAVAFYVDGEFSSSGTVSAGYTPGSTGTFVVGQGQPSIGMVSAQSFAGTIYDVRVWDEVRSEAEISLNYQQKFDSGSLPSGLIANWQMDGFDGSNEVVDIVGENNLTVGHATGTGFTASTPVDDLHIQENAANGTSVGFVVPSDPDVGNDVVRDGLFLEQTIAGDFQTFTGLITFGGWDVTNNQAVVYNGTTLFDDSPLGGRVVELGNVAGPGTISQTMDTVAGRQYQVTFAFAGDFSTGEAVKDLRVSAATATSDFSITQQNGWSPATPIWEHRTLTFTADGSSTTLSFESLDLTGSGHSVVGDIRVVEIPSAVTTILNNDPTLSYDAATGKFYKVVTTLADFATSQTNANNDLLNGVAGQLVTIRSQYEDNLIQGMIGSTSQHFYMGATDTTVEGEWRWIEDGAEADQFWSGGVGGSAPAGAYSAFAGEPGGGTGENYGMIRFDGVWLDIDGTGTDGSIIEWDASEVLSSFTFNLTDDANGRFAIDSNTGEVTVADGSLIDFESATSHNVDVAVTDAAGNSFTELSMTIAVDNSLDANQTVPVAQTIDEDATLTFISGTATEVSVTDTLAGTNARMRVTLSVDNGVLNLNAAALANVDFVEGASGTGLLVIDGTESDINAALDGMTFTPNANFNGSVTLNMTTALAANLDGHYTFDGDANDQSAGTADNGTFLGDATVVSDPERGQVLSLDGMGDSVSIPGVFGNPASVTLSAWVNLDSGGHGDLISLGDNVTLRLDETYLSNGVGLHFWNGSGYDKVSSGEFIAGTGWRHVAVTIDDAANTQSLYIDGELVASGTIANSVVYGQGTSTSIGAHGNGGATYNVDGLIDDAQVYTRALSSDEIAALAGADSRTVLFADTFDRSNDEDINASTSGQSGTVGTQDWVEVEGGGGWEVEGNQLKGGDDNATSGKTTAYVDHNFIDAEILDAGGFSVSVDLEGYTTGGSGRLIGIGVGQSKAELDSGGGAIAVSDLLVGYRWTTTDLEVYDNGVVVDTIDISSYPVDQTMRVDYSFADFDAGSTVNYQTYLGNDLITSGSFTWSGTNENFVSLYSNLTSRGALVDNFLIKTLPYNDAATTTDSVAITVNAVNDAPTFEIPGEAIFTEGDSGYNQNEASLVLSDGSMIITPYVFSMGGNSVLVKLDADGSIDTSFGTNGYADNSGMDTIQSVSEQADGKILVSGRISSSIYVARYNPDGTRDVSFGTNGWTSLGGGANEATDIAVQSDGSIIVVGEHGNDSFITRFTTTGDHDGTFGTAGNVIVNLGGNSENLESVTILADDSIIAVGETSVVKLDSNGILDTGFDTDGILNLGDNVDGVTVQSDGKFVVVGGDGTSLYATRFNADGSVDTDFGTSGTAIWSNSAATAYDVVQQSDGKLVVAGFTDAYPSQWVAVRFNTDGSLDTGFGTNGAWVQASSVDFSHAYSVGLYNDGTSEKIVIGGYTYRDGFENTAWSTMVRLNHDGSLDSTLGTNTLDGDPTFVEGGPPVVLDADVQIFDEELSAIDNYSGSTLTLVRNGGANSDDSFAFADGNGISFGAWTVGGPINYELSKNGSAIATLDFNVAGQVTITFTDADGETPTQADMNIIMSQLTYYNGSDAPPTGVQIEWTFDDGNATDQGSGGNLTVTGSTTVNITPSNDAPDGADTTITINEDTPYTFTNSDFGFTDVDGDGLLRVWVMTLPADGQLLYIGNPFPAGNWVDAADIDLGLLTYEPGQDGEGSNYASFEFQVQDDGGTANGGSNRDATSNTVTFDVTAENDAPVLDLDADDSAAPGVDFSATWTEGGVPAFIADADASLADVDSVNLTSLTVTITNLLDSANELLDADTTGTLITASYDDGTGVLTLSGSDSVANYEQVLRTVTYDNTFDHPNETARTITFEADDGTNTSNVATTTLSFVGTEEAGVTITAIGTQGVGEQVTVSELPVYSAATYQSQSVAVGSDGSSVVVWVSDAGQDGDTGSIMGRLIDAQGNPIGNEFVVNSTGTGWQTDTSVAIDASGNFAVVWTSSNQDGDSGGIYTQRFDSSGVAQGGEFLVNTTTAGSQAYSSIAMADNGDFVIAWSGNGVGDTAGVFAQRLDSNGVAQGGEFRINETTADTQDHVEIASDGNGNFVATWTSRNQDGSGRGVYMHRFDGDGNSLGGEQLVNTFTGGDQWISSVAMNDSGEFVVGWRDDGQAGGIYIQIYNSDGTTNGGPIEVPSTPEVGANYPQVAMDDIGNVTVVWQDAVDANDWAIVARQFDSSGTPLGNQFLINTHEQWYQEYPAISMNGDGQFVVVFTDYDANGDGEESVEMRRFGGATTEDGGTTNFEFVLDTQPTDDVTITLSMPDGTEGTLSTTTLTFTNADWNVAQVVTVTGVDDALADGNVTHLLVTSNASSSDAAYNGLEVRDVNVINLDNDPGLDLDADNSSGATGADFNASWAENGGAVAITDSDATLVDFDSTNLTLLTVTITNPTNGTDELLAATTTGTSIVASYDSGANVLTLSGSDTVENYQLVLQTITYDNNSESPNTSSRSISFVASDGINISPTAYASVAVTAVNDAPVLDNSGVVTFPTQIEDAGAPSGPVGTVITDLVSIGGNVTDVDAAPQTGVAITGANQTNGTWWYTTNGGTNWNALGSVSDVSGRLLNADSSTRIYFQSDPDFNGTVSNAITFRAWDRTVGSNGALHNASTNGGITAFSSASETGDLSVTAVNDTPVITGLDDNPTFVEDGLAVVLDSNVTVFDAELSAANFAGATIYIGRTGGASTEDAFSPNGLLAPLTQGDAAVYNGTNVGTVTQNSGGELTILFNSNATGTLVENVLRNIAYSNSSDTPPASVDLNWTFNDNNGGAQGTGGPLFRSEQMTVAIAATNDAPVVDNNGNLSMTSIAEDVTNSTGDSVATILASDGGGVISDVDTAAVEGIAVTQVDNTNGDWQYNTGTGWLSFGVVSDTQSVLLDTSTLIRFVPAVDYNGVSIFVFKAWDQTAGTIGDTGVDASIGGGSSAFSFQVEAVSIVVTAVNDLPVTDLNGSNGAGIDYSTSFVERDSPVAITDIDAIITDVDHADYNGLGINLSGFVDDADELIQINGIQFQVSLAATQTTTIGSTTFDLDFDGSGFTITRDGGGTMPQADLQALLRTITYENVSTITDGIRTFTIIAEDGSLANASPVSVTSITVTAVDDTPIIDLNGAAAGTGNAVTYTENDTPVAVAPDATIDDIGEADIVQLNLTASAEVVVFGSVVLPNGVADNGSVTFGGTTFLYDYDGSSAFNFVNSAGPTVAIPLSDLQLLIRAIRYQHPSDAPAAGNRGFVFTATDIGGNQSVTALATADVQAVNDAPTLSGGPLTFTSVTEDDTSPAGDIVNDLLATGAVITDPDNGAISGIAVYAVDNTNGTWQYSTNSGTTWLNFGVVSGTSAVQLNRAAMIRFVPVGDYDGSSSIDFRAWDQTSGFSGLTGVDISANGGATAFSADTIRADIDVLPVNDAAITDLDGASSAGFDFAANFAEGDTAVSVTSADATVSDVDDTHFDRLEITLTGFADGSDERITIAGSNFNPGGSLSLGATVGVTPVTITVSGFSITITESGSGTIPEADMNTLLRSIRYENTSSSPTNSVRTMSFVAFDASGLAANSASTSSITVTESNDAPVLDNTGTNSLTAIDEDNFDSTGDTVANVIASAIGNPDSITDADNGAVEGIAVYFSETTNGTWEYSTNSGISWIDFGNPSSSAALLLSETAMVRFIPNADFNGTATFSYAAWDQTAGTEGGTLQLAGNTGGSQTFSTGIDTARITVNAINDAPIITGKTSVWINEIHYDNAGIDTGEFIEVAGAAGTDLIGWSLALYNGATGNVYDTQLLSGTLTDQQNGFGTLAFSLPTDGLQNAATMADGIALVDSLGEVVQFISYDGTLTAVSGPAAGMTSTDIGITESSVTPVGDSLQLTGTGPTATWVAGPNTQSQVNTGQTLSGSNIQSETIAEDAPLVFSTGNDNAITVTDIDLATGDLLATLSVNNGTLTLASTTGLSTLIGNGTDTVSFQASIAEFDAALEGLTYHGGLNFTGSDTLTILVDDQGNTPGPALTDLATINITVTPLNDAPVLIANTSTQTAAENSDAAPFNFDTLTDVDSPDLDGGSLTFTVTSTPDASGDQLSLSNATGVTVTGGLVLVSGVNVGTISGMDSSGPLTINFTANATSVEAQTILQAFIIRNTSNDPVTSPRTIEVVATDGDGATSNTLSTDVIFTASNDAPVASNSTFDIDENLPNGSSVGSVVFTDPDLSDSHTFNITSGNTGNAFAVDAGGNISVASSSQLDFETTSSFTLEVEVADLAGLTSVATITINLADLNDNAPVIDTGQVFAISEAALNNAVVGTATAADVDTVGSIQNWSITGGNTDGIFTIDATNGEITVADRTSLDFETTNSYSLQLTVEDGNNTSTMVPVTVNITNENEAFTVSGGPYSINENSLNGTVVGQIVVTDPDIGDTHSFAITGGTGASAFTINTAGQIVVADASQLDFETTTGFTLNFSVNDSIIVSLLNQVDINVNDVNESPVISGGPTFTVDEHALIGTVVGAMSVTDQDTNDTHTFAITGGTGQSTFAIDNTGQVTVLDPTQLDFETNTSLTLNIETTDSGTGSLTDSTTIVINITDLNEAPVITGGPTFNIDENSANGTPVGTMTVTDQDGADTHTFAITGGSGQSAFTIDNNGTITVLDSSQLDFETNGSFTLAIETTDSGFGNLTDSTTVTINLVDVNEAPVIAGGPTFFIDELFGNGTSVGTISVSDPDTADTHTFAITGGTGQSAFAIDNNGTITVLDASQIDFEANESFTLTIETTDSGTGSLTDAISVVINVIDVNEAPVITGGPTFTLGENSANGTTVGTMTVTDPDAADTHTFTITGGSGQSAFAIDNNGLITVLDSSQLDFETNGSFTLDIETTDSGLANLTDATTVTINLIDVNEAPIISGGPTFSIDELFGNGTTVGALNAIDPDTADSHLFAVTGGTGQSAFAIDDNGTITVLDSSLIDFETNESFTLNIRVTDSGTGNLTDTTTVVINIVDVNEAPVITGGPTFTLSENSANGTTVGTMTVTDPDAANTHTFAITGGSGQTAFAIDNSGTITVRDSSQLDFETNGSFTLDIETTDSGLGNLSDATTVTVNLVDVNEAPALSLANLNSTIAEDTDTTTAIHVADIVVTDDGLGINQLTLSGSDAASFQIVGQQLFLNSGINLDFESQATFNVTVNVDDNSIGLSPDDTDALTLNIANVNESPSFTSAVTAIVLENTTTVHSLTATDPEADTLTYSIVGGSDAARFTLDPTTFVPGFRTAPDFESPSDQNADNIYEVQLRVADSFGNTQDQTLMVAVVNVNEAPIVTSAANHNVAENTLAVTTIGSFDPEGDSPTYSLTGTDASLFTLDPATGELQFVVAPNFESPDDTDADGVYEVLVTVDDGNGGSSSQALFIAVSDVNEQPTVVSQSISIAENTAIGSMATTATATNIDSSQQLRWRITGGSGQAAFAIDAITGNISVADATLLDYETLSSMTLDIEVTDIDSPELTATGTLSISLDDVNEQPDASGDTITVTNGTLRFSSADILGNDVDVDGNDLSAVVVTGPSNGTLVTNPDGSFSYTPTTGYAGIDSFTYAAIDTSGLGDTATVTINVPLLTVPQVLVAEPEPQPQPKVETKAEAEPDTEPAQSDRDTESTDTPQLATSTAPPAPTLTAEPIPISTPESVAEVIPQAVVADGVPVQTTKDDAPTEANERNGKTGSDFQRKSFSSNSNSRLTVRELAQQKIHQTLSESLGDLGSFEKNLSETIETQQSFDSMMAGTTTVVTGGLTVGYVVWLIRGGSLVASLISTLPAWSLFDPLPILECTVAPVKDDEESLASLVTGGVE